MESLTVRLGERSYEIVIGYGSIDRLGARIASLFPARRIFLITNTTVGRLYGARVRATLEDAGYEAGYWEMPDGEEFKSLNTAAAAYDALVSAGIERSSAVVALGGGVVGDLAGFAAATYMRGIHLVQAPTTLLAQVDSSVGGKVAVNHPLVKNLIGCFYQPRLVYTDLQALVTLPGRELRAGLAEAIKYGVIWDAALFEFLEQRLEQVLSLEPEALIELVRRSCAIKAEIVSQDERELGLRAILNFGHTVGHALEALTDYRVYRHGEAVAIGMAAAAALAVNRGCLQPGDRERLLSLLARAGLPVSFPYSTAQVLELLPHDKKVCRGKLRFVLPVAIGRVEICSGLEPDEIAAALQQCARPG